MVILIWLAIAATLFVSTFTLYIAVMKMREVQDHIFQLHWSVRWVCYLILLVGLIFDVLLNWIVLTVAFYEFPREFLSTARVVRHKHHSGGFRKIQAEWWCKHWLTPFDKSHCDK
jgi:hypothetical protein